MCDDAAAAHTSFVLTDTSQIESDVEDALARDARIKHTELIAVSVDMIGTVVAGGTVATIRQRRAAVSAARRVEGVFEVIDSLKMHPRWDPCALTMRSGPRCSGG